MKLADIKDRLTRLDTDKLIDISKNYKQYGCDNETKNFVYTLLAERGVSVEDLWLTGNIGNTNYEHAKKIFELFKRNSSTALFLYIVSLVIQLSHVVHFSAWETYPILSLILYYASIVSYLFFLIKSFLNQSNLYKLAGDDYGTTGALVYIFGGVYFYALTYFFFLKQMKEKMATIK